MSVRVNNYDVGLTSQTGGAAPLQPAGSGGSAGLSVGKTSEDHIAVSAATENINAALAAQNQQHSERIRQLGALVASGAYSVSSQNLSSAIVSSSINGSAGAK